MALLGNYFGTKVFASISGLAMAVQTTISATTPLIGGYMYDTSGSYAETFYGLAILCFSGAVLLIFLRPPLKNTSQREIMTSEKFLGDEPID